MAALTPAANSFRSICSSRASQHLVRTRSAFPRAFTSSSTVHDLETQTTSPPPAASDSTTKKSIRPKKKYVLSKRGRVPIENGPDIIGSRRRRAAIASSDGVPFALLPYQCFQEARKILADDRMEKIAKIEEQRRRIAAVQEANAATMGGEMVKKGRIMKLEQHLEWLKIMADINDPLVKKRFEDGDGDMARPIYRYLAKQKWMSMKRKIMMQRLSQMNVVPDVVPHLNPQADISISFGRRNIGPGDIVQSSISTVPPKLDIQLFTKGPKLVSIVIVDPDVPNVEKDGFDQRCHFLAANIAIDSVNGRILLRDLDHEKQVIIPWLPPHAQKGTTWHRLAILILEQPEGKAIDVADRKTKEPRMGFSTRSFIGRTRTTVLSATLFRNEWDETTAAVMQKFGLEGEDIEWKRKKSEKLPYKKKDGERYR